jgi:hypothetical protein
VPLSEHEQRLLEQMERALYAEDPKLASTLGGARQRAAQRRALALGALGLLAGTGMLIAGVAIPSVLLGVAGFAVMVAAGWYAIGGRRHPVPGQAAGTAGDSGAAGQSGRSRGKSAGSGVMDRFEERWRRRRDSRG